MQVPFDLSPLSCKGQWQKNLFNPCHVQKNESIKNIPYEVIKDFFDLIKEDRGRRKAWEKCIALQFRKWNINESPTLKSFFQVMMKLDYKIQYLLNVSRKLHDISVEMCLYGHGSSAYLKNLSRVEYVNRETLRIQANQDISKGYLVDVSYATLVDLADLINQGRSWRRMGDGLGFTFFECSCFSDPMEMLNDWIWKFNDGTLMRIYFEASLLRFNEVCEYLEGIPLEKISAIVVRDPHESDPELRLVTVFDLENFNKINWLRVSHILFNSFHSKKDDIWLSGNVTLKDLKRVFNISLCIEPKNYEGVTYNQVAFLAEAINSDSYMTDARFSELIKSKMSTCDFRIKRMSIRNSLCIYWQLNRELDLTQFFRKTFDLLAPTAPSTARILGSAYDLINPKRYYKGIT